MEERIKEIVSKNPTMSNSDIAKLIGMSKGTVQYYLKKLNIHRDRIAQQKINNTDRNTIIEISKRAREILIGTLLGDSSIFKYRRNCESVKILNSNITCGHSLKQKEYVKYLRDLLNEAGIKAYYREDHKEYISTIKGRTIHTIGRCDLATRRSISFNAWRDEWYPNGTKIVPKSIIQDFSALSLAVWFMDDGSRNNSSYFLHTEGFKREDIEFLQEVLRNKLSIETSIHQMRGQDIIYIKGQSRKLFTELIVPYICESMKYKLLT